MPARPLVFALGLLVALAGVITCATAAADDPHAFPSRSDGLLLGGLLLVVLGVAGRDPRGRQLLGRRPTATIPHAQESAAGPHAQEPAADPHAQEPAADPHASGGDPHAPGGDPPA